VLYLLKETSILGYKPAVSPMDQKTRLCVDAGQPVDRERY
jgi:hypothetical protein